MEEKVKSTQWSVEELQASTLVYLKILSAQNNGDKINKS